MKRDISLTISRYRSQRAAQRSAAVVEILFNSFLLQLMFATPPMCGKQYISCNKKLLLCSGKAHKSVGGITLAVLCFE